MKKYKESWKISRDRITILRQYTRLAAETLGQSFMLSAPLSRLLPPDSPRKTINEYFHIDTKSTEQTRIKFVKFLVLFCAKQYALDMPKIFVRFSKKLKKENHGGHVYCKNGEWYIEVSNDYKWNNKALMTIIAHEMAHVLLLSKHIELPQRIPNEELTDTVSILGGFAKVVFKTRIKQTTKTVNPIETFLLSCIPLISVTVKKITTIIKLGYLPQNEIKHLGKIKKHIHEGRPIKRFRPIYSHLNNEIDCYACIQMLRVPYNKIGKFVIKCPICQMKQLIILKGKKQKKYGFIQKLLVKTTTYFQQKIDDHNGFPV